MITERHEELWLLAAKRTAKRVQRHPTTEEIEAVYLDLLPKFSADDVVDLTQKVFVLPGLPYAYPEAPGLVLREMTEADLEVIAPRMVYQDLETSRRAGTTRMNDPFTQTLAWEFNGKLVQTESLRLKPDNSVEIGTSVHLMKRAGSFWREVERPVFERLIALGVKEMSTLTLNTLLPYWKTILVGFYKAKAGRVSPLTTQYTYPLDLSVFTGWPERRTAGPDWSYEMQGVSFREMQDADLPSVMAAIRDMHRDGPDAANQLEEKYVLDRAAVLLGYKGSALVSVRAIRPSRYSEDRGNFAIYNRVAVTPEEKVSRYVSNVWYKQLGYNVVTIFATEAQADSTSIKQYIQNSKWVTIKDEFIERGVKTYAVESIVDEAIAHGIQ